MVMGRGKRASGGASLGMKCKSHQRGVKGIKNECQLKERCDGHGGGVRGWRGLIVISLEVWEGETVDRKCDSHRKDVKCIREVCQLTERCDGYEG